MAINLSKNEEYKCPKCGKRFGAMETRNAINHIENSCHIDMQIIIKFTEPGDE